MHTDKCFSTSCSAGPLSWAHTRQPGTHWLGTFKRQRPQSWASCVCAGGDGCWPELLTVTGAARRSLPPSPSCWACRCRCQPPRSECKQQGSIQLAADKHQVSRLWCHVQLLSPSLLSCSCYKNKKFWHRTLNAACTYIHTVFQSPVPCTQRPCPPALCQTQHGGLCKAHMNTVVRKFIVCSSSKRPLAEVRSPSSQLVTTVVMKN